MRSTGPLVALVALTLCGCYDFEGLLVWHALPDGGTVDAPGDPEWRRSDAGVDGAGALAMDQAFVDVAVPDLAVADLAIAELAVPDLAEADRAVTDLRQDDLAVVDLTVADLAVVDLAASSVAVASLRPRLVALAGRE